MSLATIHTLARATVYAALALSAGLLAAQPSASEHRKPPPEALDACKALKSGQDCGFTGQRGAVKGSCFAPEGKPLACKPNSAPGDKPPQSP